MKKISLIGVLFAVVLLAGCGAKIEKSKESKKGVTTRIEQQGKNFVGGLKNAMDKGVAMKCETTEEGSNWVVYTNGKNMRSTGVFDGKKQNVLKKGDITYTWEDGSVKGQMMDLNCMKDFEKSMQIPGLEDSIEEDGDDFSFDDLADDEKSGKTKCSPSTEGDFSVPKNVNFVDQCEIMKKQMEGVKNQLKQLQN